ncbi:MAG: transposase, partial [Desulfitobacteriaceae bacterium]|nr:transposase [Desulfitobacteriaceae bacterium]
LSERLPVIKETDVTDLYVDGGYWSPEVEEQAQENHLTIHYTNMTGTKPAPEKISLAEFSIEDRETILACPEGQPVKSSKFKEKNRMLIAHFDPAICQQCPRRDACPVRFQGNSAVVRASQKAVLAAQTRARIYAGTGHDKAVSKRVAIEGTNSTLKRKSGADKLRVRGLAKVKVVMGLKIIGHNFGQIVRFFQGKARRPMADGIPTTGGGATSITVAPLAVAIGTG